MESVVCLIHIRAQATTYKCLTKGLMKYFLNLSIVVNKTLSDLESEFTPFEGILIERCTLNAKVSLVQAYLRKRNKIIVMPRLVFKHKSRYLMN